MTTTPPLTLAEIDANPAAGLILSAQKKPLPPRTHAEHAASCLAYAERQPAWIDAEIARLTVTREQWVEAVGTLRRITDRLTKGQP